MILHIIGWILAYLATGVIMFPLLTRIFGIEKVDKEDAMLGMVLWPIAFLVFTILIGGGVVVNWAYWVYCKIAGVK